MLGCVVVGVVFAVGGVFVVNCGLLLSRWEYEVSVYVGSEVCGDMWSCVSSIGIFVFASIFVC
jgi:hypothetical protein